MRHSMTSKMQQSRNGQLWSQATAKCLIKDTAVTDKFLEQHIMPHVSEPTSHDMDWESLGNDITLTGLFGLSKLSISGCTNVSWHVVVEILSKCPNLVSHISHHDMCQSDAIDVSYSRI